MTEDVADAVQAAEMRRCRAMLRNDGAALDALLDPQLCFHHASGAVDDKPALLAKIAAGRIEYIGINWDEELVTPLAADVAMLTGRMVTDVKVEGVDKRLDNRVITVWRRSEGAWRLAAFQSTPMAS